MGPSILMKRLKNIWLNRALNANPLAIAVARRKVSLDRLEFLEGNRLDGERRIFLQVFRTMVRYRKEETGCSSGRVLVA